MPWSRTTSASAVVVDASRRSRPTSPGSEYLIALSSRLTSALAQLAVVARRSRRRAASGTTRIGTSAVSAAACTRSTASRDQQRDRHRLARRRFLGLDRRLRSSRSSTIRASRSASRTTRSASCCTTAGVVGRGHRLGEQAERADRRLQLVAHVGDEVAPHALDAPATRMTSRVNATAPTTLAVAPQRERAELEHLARRPVELELALPTLRPASACCSSSVDRVLGEHLAVARAVEPARRASCARPRARCGRPRRSRRLDSSSAATQPVLHRFGLRNPVVGLAADLVRSRSPSERRPSGRRARADHAATRGAAARPASDDEPECEPPEQTGDDEQDARSTIGARRVGLIRTGR